MKAVANGLCFAHSQLPHAQIFQWALTEIEDRIRCLTTKQLQALELVCDGQTYEVAATVLGVAQGTFCNRLSSARAAAGVATVQQLIVLYAIWRALKVHAEYQSLEMQGVTPL
jgi:predicted DNA-binding protein (UPF0251 family)